MNFDEKEYLDRLVDKEIERYLQVFGAISVEGPKWCGKTWTSFKHAKSWVFLDNDYDKSIALFEPDLILNKEAPELIDEWTYVPEIWDKVRRKCDENNKNGKYILTCSTELNDDEFKKKVKHSGAGRIGKIKMYPMSLYEAKISKGEASLTDMLNNKQKNVLTTKYTIEDVANMIVRGGWPRNLNVDLDKMQIIPKSYIESILNKDIDDGKKRDKNKMNMLLKSLARNESTIASIETLINDIEEYNSNEEILQSRITVNDYLDVLNRLHLIENQEAYSNNYRSRNRVGKSVKRHFTDPSIACAVLNLTSEKLIKDLKTFGLMFESLVERDLRIYAEYLGGKLYHFRDNISGLEVDSIIEFVDGEYCAIEVKLGFNEIEAAKKTLLKFADNMLVKPKFMAIIVSNIDTVVKDKETGIYILPITALKP